ncbi:MAG: glycoside hydrolase family 127 protein, partial [Candidatus Sumerlaeota bacterium]|nr:glycoside hydrolase family 127 protein [Candidatus Sumerlaeota bacterium]
AAQEPDGYLYTTRTVDPAHVLKGAGPARWSNLRQSHELYCPGHMYEAAVAYYQGAGKRSLLDVAMKSVDLIDRTFGPDKMRNVPGHQEIELGLVKLYRATGDERCLRLAKYFLNERGQADSGRQLGGPYNQDHLPVIEQAEAVGHAVRAGYMYAGMADVAALTGDAAYGKAIDALWRNVVGKKLYLTAGVGARHQGEAFGEAYELPNASAYNETCAAIALLLWAQRMFLLHGDAQYVDVVERVLYNGFLSGISLSGDRFFYPNPLASDGKDPFNKGAAQRQPWFGCACCPPNVARVIASMGQYVYAHRADALYVNLFIAGDATVKMDGGSLRIAQETRYPWEGKITIRIEPDSPREFTLSVRVPGWARGEVVPSDLYRFVDQSKATPTLQVNGQTVALEMDQGFARIRRTWKKGDAIVLNLPMTPRRVVTHLEVKDDAGRVAVERGPIVYCAEGVDNGGRALDLALSDGAALRASFHNDLLGGIETIEAEANGQSPPAITLIPYYAWAHREPGEMAVWLMQQQ